MCVCVCVCMCMCVATACVVLTLTIALCSQLVNMNQSVCVTCHQASEMEMRPTLHYTDVDFIMGINYPANKQAGTFLLCKFTLPYQLDFIKN